MANVKISAKPASSATYDGTEFLAGIQTGADAKFAASQIYAAATKAATAKLTPAAGDLIGVADSAASFGLKSFSWAAIQQYFTNLFGAGGSATAPTDFKDSVAVATTANITLSGEQTIDGVLTSASRVLVKDQTVGSQNGIYVSAAGAWSRSTDADTSAEVTSGMMVEVEAGTISASLVYILITNNPITLATTALVFQAILLPFSFFVYKTVAGTTYTTVLLDSAKRLLATNAATKTITVAPQSSVAAAVNTEIEIFNAGAGLLTIAAGVGVTLNSLSGILTVAQNQCVKLKKRANPNTWDVTGILPATASGGSKTYGVFNPMTSCPPATVFATLDTRNSFPVLEFDAAADEGTFWTGVMPEAASLGSGLIANIAWMGDTATSGNVVWGLSFMRLNTDLDADSYDTEVTVTTACSGTSGIPVVSSITNTNIDGITAGDAFSIRVRRIGSSGSDTMTGDAQVLTVELRSAA